MIDRPDNDLQRLYFNPEIFPKHFSVVKNCIALLDYLFDYCWYAIWIHDCAPGMSVDR